MSIEDDSCEEDYTFYHKIGDASLEYSALLERSEKSKEEIARLRNEMNTQRELFLLALPVAFILYLYGILHGLYTCS